MTKLQEWLLTGVVLVALWFAMLNDKVPAVESVPRIHILLLPVYAAAAFGFISAAIILYRVATFNDCDEAAAELKGQIKEAKSFLKEHGLIVGKQET